MTYKLVFRPRSVETKSRVRILLSTLIRSSNKRSTASLIMPELDSAEFIITSIASVKNSRILPASESLDAK